jgi:hypothetical protein
MHQVPEDYFGERVAERFDERYAHLADSAVVDPIAKSMPSRRHFATCGRRSLT